MREERIAVVGEDDSDVRDLIELVLTQSGFQVVTAENGPTTIDAVRRHQPILTTLDINMPGMDGFAVAKEIRDFSHTYLIMITSLDDEIDVVRGFEAGADDYLVKPFRPRELRARADSMLRRAAFTGVAPNATSPTASGAQAPSRAPEPESWAAAASRELREEGGAPAAPSAPPSPATPQAPPSPAAAATPAPSGDGLVHFRDLTVDESNGRATWRGVHLDLTQVEANLLLSLVRSGRRVRSKADLVLVMRGHQFVTSHFVNEADKRQVERVILGLMRKLGDDGASGAYIEAVKGVGFRMAESPA